MKKTIMMSLLSLFVTIASFGQITTSTLSGVVKNEKGEILVGASIHAVHQPTGTEYKTSTNKQGRYVIPAVRPGGPYVVHFSYVGFKTKEVSDINTSLGVTSNVDMILTNEIKSFSSITVVGTKNNLFSKDKNAYQYLSTSAQNFPFGEALNNILRKIGFIDVQDEPQTMGVASIYLASKK